MKGLYELPLNYVSGIQNSYENGFMGYGVSIFEKPLRC
jgi:hypothetical protein